MRCLHPVIINIDAYGKHYKSVPVPCGKCEACIQRRAQDWQIRLYEELKVSSSAYFITLTYNDSELPYVEKVDTDSGEIFWTPSNDVRDIQKFVRRLRDIAKPFVHPFKFRYFIVSEYGPKTRRPHYHGIIFNWPSTLATEGHLTKLWGNGFVSVSPVSEGRIAYTTKYCFAADDLPDVYNPNFMVCSKRPAIGHTWFPCYINQLETRGLDECYYFKDGYKLPVPRYYRKKFIKEFEDELSKRERLDDYVANNGWIDFKYEAECVERIKKLEAGSDWYETETEQKKRRFLKNFYKKYYKNRKI